MAFIGGGVGWTSYFDSIMTDPLASSSLLFMYSGKEVRLIEDGREGSAEKVGLCK